MSALQDQLNHCDLPEEEHGALASYLPKTKLHHTAPVHEYDDGDDIDSCPTANTDQLVTDFLISRDDHLQGDTDENDGDVEADMSDQDESMEDGDPVPSEEVLVVDMIAKGCCHQHCITKWTVQDILDYRLHMQDLDSEVLDMLILGKLEAGQYDPARTSGGAERHRQHFKYTFRGSVICKEAFRLIHGLGKKLTSNLVSHFHDNGAVPRVHGNKGKLPHNTTPFPVFKATLDFIVNYGEENGLPMPAAPGRSKSSPPIFLPSNMSKKSVFKQYSSSANQAGDRSVKYSLFCSLWRQCVPHIQIMSLQTDVCDKCRKHRDEISSARIENDKLEKTRAYTAHVTDAIAQRDEYLKQSREAREELESRGLLTTDTAAPTYQTPALLSADLQKVHYTFDYSQPVTLPHQAQQAGPLYFLNGRKIQVDQC